MYQDKIIHKLIYNNSDLNVKTVNDINKAVSLIFPDKKFFDLFEIIKEYMYKYGEYPSLGFIESYFSMDNSDSDAKIGFSEVVEEESEEPIDALIDYQIRYTLKNDITNEVDNFKNNLRVTSIDDVIETVGVFTKNVISKISIADSSNKDVISLKSRDAYVEEKDRLDNIEDTYYMSQFDIPPFDDGIGGVKDGDCFLGILASAKQFKSTLLRYMVYKQLTQGKNVLFISLEISIRTIKEHFYVLHSNNTDRWGLTHPTLTVNKIRRKTLSDDEKSFYLEVVKDFNDSTTLGDLVLLTPKKKYTFQDMTGDIIEQQATMDDLNLVVIDYLALVSPKFVGRIDVQDYNDMIKQTRLFGLENSIAIWTPLQANRMGFKKTTSTKEEDVKYDLTDIGMYSEFEKSLTDAIYIVQSKEMKLINSVKVGSVLHRESPGFEDFFMQVNPQTGWFYINDGIKVDNEEEVIKVIQNLTI